MSRRPLIFVTFWRGKWRDLARLRVKALTLSERDAYNICEGNLRIEYIYASISGNSGRPRISRIAHGIDLGLDTVGSAAQTEDHAPQPVSDKLHTCYNLGLACRSNRCIRANDSRVPVLRSPPYADIRIGIFASSWRDRSWTCWCLATEFTALARSCFRTLYACILANHGVGGVNLQQAAEEIPATSSP